MAGVLIAMRAMLRSEVFSASFASFAVRLLQEGVTRP